MSGGQPSPGSIIAEAGITAVAKAPFDITVESNAAASGAVLFFVDRNEDARPFTIIGGNDLVHLEADNLTVVPPSRWEPQRRSPSGWSPAHLGHRRAEADHRVGRRRQLPRLAPRRARHRRCLRPRPGMAVADGLVIKLPAASRSPSRCTRAWGRSSSRPCSSFLLRLGRRSGAGALGDDHRPPRPAGGGRRADGRDAGPDVHRGRRQPLRPDRRRTRLQAAERRRPLDRHRASSRAAGTSTSTSRRASTPARSSSAFAGFLSSRPSASSPPGCPTAPEGFSLLIIISAEFGARHPARLRLHADRRRRPARAQPHADARAARRRASARARSRAIMFPHDIVANAPQIISDLRHFFPPQRGHVPDRADGEARLGYAHPGVACRSASSSRSPATSRSSAS